MSATRERTATLRRRTAEVTDRHDVTLLLTASALTVIGLIMTLSASSAVAAASTGSAFSIFGRQFMWAALGLVALLVFWRIDYRRLRGWAYAAVPGVWFLLVLTIIPGVGTEAYGASRWLPLGPLSFQPSETAKLVLLVFGADVLARKLPLMADWRHVAVPFLAAVGVTCLLVLMQPDFGTTVIIGGSAMLIAFLAGVRLQFLGTLSLIVGVLAFPVMLMERYRFERFMAFLNSDSNQLDGGYQAAQGLIALGSGGLFGMGLGSSRQKYSYLPNAHTDFVFAILGEETGLAGTLTVLVLFALMAVLGIRIARRASDPFGFLLASGVIGWLSLQAVINIGAVTGILPITGVPLPLISFGGSSLLFSLAAIGVVASVGRHAGERPRRRREPG